MALKSCDLQIQKRQSLFNLG